MDKRNDMHECRNAVKFFFLSKSNSQWSRQVLSGPRPILLCEAPRRPELVQPAGADRSSLRALRGPYCMY